MNRGFFAQALRWVGAGAAALLVASCGGGSNTCSDNYGGNACSGQPDPTAVVANLSLTLSDTKINNVTTATVTATVIATNSSNQTMDGAAVLLSVDSNAQIAVDGSATGSDGSLTGTIRVGEDRSKRTITVTASANNGDLVVRKTLAVVGAELTGTPIPAVVATGANGEIQFRLVDANSNPMPGVAIVVTGPNGVETSATTGDSGDYDYTYTAPSTSGAIRFAASAGGDDTAVDVQVENANSNSIPDVAASVNVQSKSISVSPSVVNAGGDAAALRVLFVGDNNAPIENMRVRFDLAGDANSIGGTIKSGSSLLYTNANGVVTTNYISGDRASPTDGVTVRACWSKSDFPAKANGAPDPAVGSAQCPNAVTATLTVVDEPVSISIGTNNLIETGTSGLTYVKRYIVQVVDASGLAKTGVQISPSIDLLRYIKGHYEIFGDQWAKAAPITSCDNEDLNRNNTNETYADGHVEDINGSFNLVDGRPALEPRKADVAISIEGSDVTDSSGNIVLRLEYPQNLGTWVEFNILVTAGGVSASEGRANYTGILPVPAEPINTIDAEPPFRISPYGVEAGNPVAYNYGGTDYLLCTNPN